VLRERLEAAGLEVWSLEPEIDVIGSDRKRYTCDGTHWSPAGHAVVARGLFERLDQSGLADFLLASRRRSPRD
jgi:lysophospholipase L1-like esterase